MGQVLDQEPIYVGAQGIDPGLTHVFKAVPMDERLRPIPEEEWGAER